MIQDLLDDLRSYLGSIPRKTEQEQNLLRRLNEGYFPISSIHRDDLTASGFDVREVTDDQMECLAKKMGGDYCEQLFWPSMEIIASGYCGIPKFAECPVCRAQQTRFNTNTQTYHCGECNLSWGDDYIRVENLEQTDRLPEEIGYPSMTSTNSNSRYIPEYDYIRLFGASAEPDSHFKPVMWPESQKYMSDEKHNTHAQCELINDESGLCDFGQNAFWVPGSKRA